VFYPRENFLFFWEIFFLFGDDFYFFGKIFHFFGGIFPFFGKFFCGKFFYFFGKPFFGKIFNFFGKIFPFFGNVFNICPFEIRILDLSQSHTNAHFPNFAYILNTKFKKQLNIFFSKSKMIYKKLKTLFCLEFNYLYYYVFLI
jgi:hypothetical protein